MSYSLQMETYELVYHLNQIVPKDHPGTYQISLIRAAFSFFRIITVFLKFLLQIEC